MCQNGIKSDGRRCQKRNRIDTFDDGLSSRSMTTTAAKGANNPQKMSQFGADNATFSRRYWGGFYTFSRRCSLANYTFSNRRTTTAAAPDHTFPEVLLGFLHIFPNKKPLSSGFLEGYLIAFSDSHFGITGFTSFGHSISMTTSSDDVGRSATK